MPNELNLPKNVLKRKDTQTMTFEKTKKMTL